MSNNSTKLSIPFKLTLELDLDQLNSKVVSAEAMLPEKAGVTKPSTTEFAPISEAEVLKKAKEVLGSRKDVLNVRLGYKFENGWITRKRAIVVTVNQRKTIAELAKENVSALPPIFEGFPVDITTPTIEDLLSKQKELTRPIPIVERESRYFPPDDVHLKKFTDKPMKVRVFVSPEEGWNELSAFLTDTKKTLSIAMYDFGAPHIIKTIEGLANNNGFKKFLLTLQPGESIDKRGVKKNDKPDEETVQIFENAFGDKFTMSWVHIGSVNGWVNSSYHIKVAVRDKKAIYLSSGNYQSSNQPNLAELDDTSPSFLLGKYNREWHAIVEHEELAEVYEKFIEHDFKNNRPDGREAIIAKQDLFLLVPKVVEVEAEALPKERFGVFEGDRNFTLTPILSPDNYFDEVLKLVKSAQRELYIQNQTFNCPKDGHAALEKLVSAVLDKQNAGVDVKIIFRNMNAASARENLELLVDMGFDASSFKANNKVHTKGIIVDERFVLLGSQNWSNDGVSVNRDASLLFDDPELAKFMKKVFLHDWFRVARPFIGRESFGPTIVGPNDPVPEHMEAIPLGDILETL